MGIMEEKLTLHCMAIGSLPHKDVKTAMNIVKQNFPKIPFWPQLAKFNKNEDMIVQFLEQCPGLTIDKTSEKIYIENESDEFFQQLETLFIDYEEVVLDSNTQALDKYEISENNSSTFHPFLEIIKETEPSYAKGQIVGPFTLATTLTDKDGKCIFYDETLRESIVKLLSLKALWQIKKIKQANPNTTPIIFIDEPSISQLGTSAFITISKNEVISVLKEVAEFIKSNGAISAIHCCGKCDWTILIKSGINIINLDAYFFAQNLGLFSEELKPFLSNGGIIAWGLVPTLDKEALKKVNPDELVLKFEQAIGYLTKKGVDQTLLINNSMITPSCGAGSLSIDLAEKAMTFTKELSLKLKEKFNK